MQVDIRHDWTPSEKLEFEDVALEFIATVSVRYQTHKRFENWIQKYHPEFSFQSDIVWSYVLAN